MLFIGANTIKEDGIDNLVSLQTEARAVYHCSCRGPFLSFAIYSVLLKENNSIHHFYCQIKVMFP